MRKSPFGLLALCLVALGCDTFADPGSSSDEVGPPPNSTTANGGPFGFDSGASGGLDVATASAGPDAGGFCFPCGQGCKDCGRGCSCAEQAEGPEPWLLPFAPGGAQGWMDGPEPFCAGLTQTDAGGIWSDGAGVYALVSGVSDRDVLNGADEDAGNGADPAFGMTFSLTRLLHNDGQGWSVLADLPGASSTIKLSGIPPSSPVLYDSDGSVGTCVLNVISDGRTQCQTNSAGIMAVQPIGEGRALALRGRSELLAWDGAQWQADPRPLPQFAEALWADADEIIAVGGEDVMRRVGSDDWTVESLLTARLTAVWARNAHDVWVGTVDGKVLHLEDGTWQGVTTLGGVTCSGVLPVKGIVGAGEHVWMYTDRQLSRWDGERLETFGNWSCLSSDTPDVITSVSANAEDDVFVNVVGSLGTTRCGAAFVVHYDGTAFHRF